MALQPVTANPSIERTAKRLRLLSAAHVERYASLLRLHHHKVPGHEFPRAHAH